MKLVGLKFVILSQIEPEILFEVLLEHPRRDIAAGLPAVHGEGAVVGPLHVAQELDGSLQQKKTNEQRFRMKLSHSKIKMANFSHRNALSMVEMGQPIGNDNQSLRHSSAVYLYLYICL